MAIQIGDKMHAMSDREMLMLAYGALKGIDSESAPTEVICSILESHLWPIKTGLINNLKVTEIEIPVGTDGGKVLGTDGNYASGNNMGVSSKNLK